MYPGFDILRTKPIPELQSTLQELIHTKTGARIMHLANNDPENVFCLSLKTLPSSSNGVAHILEHVVLCGSKKFPVKDPFFAMTHRSLNTFMNAMTGADFTCYPAASLNEKDFYNLLEVYLDAVFAPNLEHFSFLQEGHRLEFSNPKDPSSALEYKGIVYNEMKGAMSSVGSRLNEALHQLLFPDLTYGVNSGGDPKVIPELTYEELKEFHHTYYHPSRCLFFFYGNLPLEKHLNFITKHCLDQVEAASPIPLLPPQKRYLKPVYTKQPYPFAPNEDASAAHIFSMGWLSCPIGKQEDVLALAVLITSLMCTDASPLRDAILKSGFCKQASGNIDEEMSEIPIVLTMRGCTEQDAAKLEKVVMDALQELYEKGIPKEHLESALHQVEFQRVEITGDHYPFGLTLFMRAGLLQQHGADPERGLVIHSLFDHLRAQWKKNPSFFQDLLKHYFIDNPHRVHVTLFPDNQLEKKEVKEELERLASLKSTLKESDAKSLVTQAKKLEAYQKKQEDQDLEVLPKVTLKDVPKDTLHYALSQTPLKKGTLYHHDCFTNDVVYLDWHCDLAPLKKEELPLLKLLDQLLPQLGCGGKSYRETLEYVQAHTGGVSVSIALHAQATDYKEFRPQIGLTGKALGRKKEKLLPLFREMILSPNFTEKQRIIELLKRHFTWLQTGLASHALNYALGESGSSLSAIHRFHNEMSGLPYFHWVRTLIEQLDTRIDPLIEELQALHKRLFQSHHPELILSANGATKDWLLANEEGLLSLPGSGLPTEPFAIDLKAAKKEIKARFIPAPVAFIGWTLPTKVSYADEMAPALAIATNLLDKKVLHPVVREQGGAYGSSANLHLSSGALSFYSYRDPNIASTLTAFRQAAEEIASGKFTAQDLEEAKLEVIQDIDDPVSPGSRAIVSHSYLKKGRTAELQNRFRALLLGATKAEVTKAVEKKILERLNDGVPCIMAGKELIEKELPKIDALGIGPVHCASI